jgi:hypothetical protein
MAAKLGKPKPPLPESFMKPDEERKIYDMFRVITQAVESPQELDGGETRY